MTNGVPPVPASPSTYRFSRWTQGLALLLVVLMGVQGMPLHSLISSPAADHVCEETEFCPRSGGECQCQHHAPTSAHHSSEDEAPQTVLIQPCPMDHSNAIGPSTPSKWLVSSQQWTLAPRTWDLRGHTYSSLEPQDALVDIFRPPWHRADV